MKPKPVSQGSGARPPDPPTPVDAAHPPSPTVVPPDPPLPELPPVAGIESSDDSLQPNALTSRDAATRTTALGIDIWLPPFYPSTQPTPAAERGWAPNAVFMATSSKSHERGEPGLDALRAVAVVMMFAVHVRRVQTPQSRTGAGIAEALLDFFMRIEPFITSLFLFVAGYSVVLAFRAGKSRKAWWAKAGRRALQLYLLSIGLFVLQYGVDLPDLLLSSGILQVIALSVLCVGACLSTRAPELALLLASILGFAVTAALEAWGTSVSGLNAGPGGNTPLMAHACFGALTALAVARNRRGALGRLLLITGVLSGAALLVQGDWTTTHISQYRDLGGQSFITAAISGALQDAPLSSVSFWNHSTRGAAALLFTLVGMLAIFLLPASRLFRASACTPLRLVGRHALFVYVFHLCALGVIDASGLNPTSAALSWGLVAALFGIGVVLSIALERLPAIGARAQRRDSSPKPQPKAKRDA